MKAPHELDYMGPNSMFVSQAFGRGIAIKHVQFIPSLEWYCGYVQIKPEDLIPKDLDSSFDTPLFEAPGGITFDGELDGPGMKGKRWIGFDTMHPGKINSMDAKDVFEATYRLANEVTSWRDI